MRELGFDSISAVVVLGSGWWPLAQALGEPIATVTYADAGLRPVAAPGHRGEASVIEMDGHRILVLSGRTHLYEGHGPAAVALNIRVAAELGAKICVLTNANGSLFKDWELGSVMVISDHLNLTGTSPLEGANFVDLTDLYDAELREALLSRAAATGVDLHQGVYAQLAGPHYETAAEARMVAIMGGDALGMSTAIDAIAAREAGMRVLGLSTVTAHEASGEFIDPDEVIATAERSAGSLGDVIRGVLVEALGAR